MDVARISRQAYADAFHQVTGRPLVALPQMAGKTDSEIFFEFLALNEVASGPAVTGDQDLLARYISALAAAFRSRRASLPKDGRLLSGAAAAVAAVADLPGVVQSVLTGTIRPNAVEKLRAFGLDPFFDLDIGGYGSEIYPMGALLLRSRGRAAEKYGVDFGASSTVYVADSHRDVEAARMGGARCLAVASGRSTAGDLAQAGADLVISDLSDAAEVVSAIDRLAAPAATR